jgi:hypothetical protein
MNTPNKNEMIHLSDELLSERLDGLLDAATQTRVDAHLATCANCAARHVGMQQVRATLHALHTVADIPDFRLNAQGQSRRPRRYPVVLRPSFGRAVARLVSAAVLLGGLALIVLALNTSASHILTAANASIGAANYSTTGHTAQSHPSCTTPHCPTVATPLPVGASTAPPPTPRPTNATAATPMPSETTDTTPPTTGPPSGQAELLPVPLEFGLGFLLAIGGLIAFVQLGRQTR